MFAGMTRTAHAPFDRRWSISLFFNTLRLNEQAAINSLVGHVHILVVGITGLQPSGNLFGRPVQHQFYSQPRHATWRLPPEDNASGATPTPMPADLHHVGTISRTTTMAGDLPAHRRGGSFQEAGRSHESTNQRRFLVRCLLGSARVSDNASADERRSYAATWQQQLANGGMWPAISAPNLVLRMPALPSAPECRSFLR